MPVAALDFRRIAILNRGEPAVRFLRALHEYNLERHMRIESLALFTDPDAGAPYVRQADRAVSLGPALAQVDGRAISAYCDVARVLAVLRDQHCDAVWPGWGFASEDATFVAALEDAGITFLGPSAAAMRLLGDKLGARALAVEANVPLAPSYEIRPDDDETQLLAAAAEVGFPLMVKASAGGGGRGIRRVETSGELLAAVASVVDEVRRVFGEGGVYLERVVDNARHIEVQFIVGVDGRAVALGVRDCSLQRRHQKVIEEAPSPILPPLVETRLCESTVQLAERAGYRGVGTAEFLFTPGTGLCAFLEVNSRLQVEHTVTELITGIDLVKAQIDIARGLPWRRDTGIRGGWAIQARLNAEDVEHGFRPAPGTIRVFRAPSGPGIRIDAGVVEGQTIAPDFDSMIAKVIAWGPSRNEAIARLERALAEFEVVIEDGATNKGFLLEVLRDPAFLEGRADTRWLDREAASGRFGGAAHELEALLCAAIIAHGSQQRQRVQRFLAEVHNGVPQNVPAPGALQVDLKARGRRHQVRVWGLSPTAWAVQVGEDLHTLNFEPTGAHGAMLSLDGRQHRVLYSFGRHGVEVEVDGALHRIERSSGGTVRAPAPALVAAVAVEEGATVAVGDLLCTLEAMKMETPVFAEEDGVVESVLCRPNQQVAAGQALMVLRRAGQADDAPAAEEVAPTVTHPLLAIDIPWAVRTLEGEAATMLVSLVVTTAESVLLGWDVPDEVRRVLEGTLQAVAVETDAAAAARWLPLLGLLHTFADVEALFDRRMLALDEETVAVSAEGVFYEFCRRHQLGLDAMRPEVQPLLQRALQAYGVFTRGPSDALRDSLFRLAQARAAVAMRFRVAGLLLRVALGLRTHVGSAVEVPQLHEALTRIAALAEDAPAVADQARQAAWELFERPRYVRQRQQLDAAIAATLDGGTDADESGENIRTIVCASDDCVASLLEHASSASIDTKRVLLASIVGRLYAHPDIDGLDAAFQQEWLPVRCGAQRVWVALWAPALGAPPAGPNDAVQVLVAAGMPDAALTTVPTWVHLGPTVVTWRDATNLLLHRGWKPAADGALLPWAADLDPRIHPHRAERLGLARFAGFRLVAHTVTERILTLGATARTVQDDQRWLAFGEVMVPARDPARANETDRQDIDRTLLETLNAVRTLQQNLDARRRAPFNRLELHLRAPVRLRARGVMGLASQFDPATRGLGLEVLSVQAPILDADASVPPVLREFQVRRPGRHRVEVRESAPTVAPLAPLTAIDRAAARARRMGLPYPWEVLRMLVERAPDGHGPHPDIDGGTFVEYDLHEDGARLVPVERPWGQHTASLVCGLVRNPTRKHPEGIVRVFLASDPTMAMGALSEPECRRVIAALDLARDLQVPVEWLPVSAGARIAMDSGTENLDWTAAVLRRIVEFTAVGGEIHIVVAGVNVGAQSYWNSMATMLMHTRGVLIMTPAGSMVLTGKKALEYSGGVSAEDERGIGGFERIMGPNGQAQYLARDLGEAWSILFEHYRHTYRAPGETQVRPAPSTDPRDRDVCLSPYPSTLPEGFASIGEIFDAKTNPGRRRPFAIRAVMAAVVDQDAGRLERFRTMRHAETAVVWDSHIGGHAATVIGFESRPIPRRGRVPLDGPDTWTGGTLFPQSSRKVARAIRGASGNRPVVVVANLSGFDGSPESLRRLQLEYGAEIGRAVVEFQGPIVFVVIGRYHGGAYVVFSKALNPQLTAMAIDGAYASVIGGAPAAAVVFPREVQRMVEDDPRIEAARAAVQAAQPGTQRARLQAELETQREHITLEKQGEVARSFDAIHSVERAVAVGSLDAVIRPSALRPAIIDVLDRAQR